MCFRYVCIEPAVEVKQYDADYYSEIYAEIASIPDTNTNYTTLDPRTCSEQNLDKYAPDVVYESDRNFDGCIREIVKRSNSDTNNYNHDNQLKTRESSAKNDDTNNIMKRNPSTPPSCHNIAYDCNDIETYDVVLSVPHDGQTRF